MMKKVDLQQLFRQHYAEMLRVARTFLYDEQESQDVVSDIFAHLLRGQTVLQAGTEEGYLLTSVRNQCLKRLRHEEMRRRMEAWTAAEAMPLQLYEDERLTDIEEWVATHLSPQEQRIFRLRFADGYRYDEIAASEGISRVAVWKHLSHVLNLIRNHFKQ